MLKISDINFINTGDTLLVSSKSFLGKTIQDFENCKWNHAGMFWWAYDELMIVEADKRGIAITPFKEYMNSKSNLLLLKPIFVVDGVEYGKFILPYAGHTRYGFFNLIIAQPIKFITGIWIGPKNDDTTKTFICGEFVEFVYHHFNDSIFQNWNKDAPVDLFKSELFSQYNIIK